MQSTEQQPAQLPTHPLLVLYALTTIAYCESAKKTDIAIRSGDFSAEGLFPIQYTNYKMPMNKVEPSSIDPAVDASSADVDRMKAVIAEVAEQDPEAAKELIEASAELDDQGDSELTGIEDTTDIEEQLVDPPSMDDIG